MILDGDLLLKGLQIVYEKIKHHKAAVFLKETLWFPGKTAAFC